MAISRRRVALSPDLTTGFVFYHSRLTAEIRRKGLIWTAVRPYSRVVYIDCAMDAFIRPEGWNNWNDAKNEATAWYGEYGSTGSGARSADRGRLVASTDSATGCGVSADVFLRGSDGWNPAAK